MFLEDAARRRSARTALVVVSLSASFWTRPAAALGPSTTSPEQGFDLGGIDDPRSIGMSGAQVATGGSVNAIYDNPANMTLSRVYHIEALSLFSPEARRDSFGGGIVDSSMNSAHLAGGLAGAWNLMDPSGIDRKWADVRVGLAFPFGDRIAIGVTGRYAAVNQGVSAGPFGGSLVSDGTPSAAILKAFTFDAGANLMIVQGLRLGLVGHNLTGSTNPLLPMTFEGGLGYAPSPLFTIEGAGLLDITTWNAARYRLLIGGEVLLADHVLVRAGFRYDQATATSAPSVGLGYTDRQWAVEAGARHDVAGANPNTVISLSLKLFYDPMAPTSSDGMGL